MILWLLLFLLIVAISFILAYQSMKDFREVPGIENSVFLIREIHALTNRFLESLYESTKEEGDIISLERLVKGTQSALVIFGPKNILQQYITQLNLLELEDYTKVDPKKISIWEMVVKDRSIFETEDFEILKNLPSLEKDEQLWWQVILKAQSTNDFKKFIQKVGINESYHIAQNKINASGEQKTFRFIIRVVLISGNAQRRKQLYQIIENIKPDKLTKIPRPLSGEKLLQLYQQRVMHRKDPSQSISSVNLPMQIITSREILKLI